MVEFKDAKVSCLKYNPEYKQVLAMLRRMKRLLQLQILLEYLIEIHIDNSYSSANK